MSHEYEHAHEGRRTAVVLVLVGGVAIALILAMYWMLTSSPSPSLASNQTTVSPAEPAASDTPITAPPSTTFTPPAPTRVTTTGPPVSVAPPELPTMTDPPESATSATPAAPPATTTKPVAPGISNVALTCTKDGKKVTARLTFTTTTKIDVTLVAGGDADRTSTGPGNESMTHSGRRGGDCAAVVGTQTIGPVPAT